MTRELFCATRPRGHKATRPIGWFALALCLLLLLGQARVAYAQQILVEASVDQNQVSTDDVIVLTVQVNAQPDVQPTLPTLDAFRVVGTSSASQISIVNGVTSATFAYRYQLRPIEPGNYRIDEITVIVDNQRYQSNAITIEVTQGVNPLPSDQGNQIIAPTELEGQDFYVEARVDNDTPYLGQQILYIFQFFQALELAGRPSYGSPDFIGFWNQQENQQSSTLSDVAGRTYRITTLFSPLFGTTPGEREIAPSEFTLPDGRILQTKAVNVDVRPLPEPAPETFSGAVGNFAIEDAVDKTVVGVGEAVVWRVLLSGVGNIETLPEPTWPEIDGWRTFEDRSSVSTEFANGIIQGERLYERILIPSEIGEFELPSLEYVYFNPTTEAYETAATQPRLIVVQEGSGVVDGVDSAESSPALDILGELAPLRDTPNRLRQPRNIIGNPIFWSLWALPLIALIGDRASQWRRERREQRELEAQKRNAFKIAQQAIKDVRAGNINLADQQAERILTAYLGDKFDDSFVGLSQASRSQQLRALGVRESLIRWTNKLYDQAEGLRFGYKGGKPGKLLAEVEQLISRFERAEAGVG